MRITLWKLFWIWLFLFSCTKKETHHRQRTFDDDMWQYQKDIAVLENRYELYRDSAHYSLRISIRMTIEAATFQYKPNALELFQKSRKRFDANQVVFNRVQDTCIAITDRMYALPLPKVRL